MQNYRQYLKDGGEKELEEVYSTGAITYRCQKCNKPTDSVCLVNVTPLGNIREEHTWVCDQCITDWKRAKTKIDPTDDFIVPAEWDVRFLEKVGCYEEDYIATKLYAMKHVKQRYRDVCKLMKRDSSLIDEKQKIEQKYGNPTSINKKRIKANNQDESIISNIPEGSTVYIDDKQVGNGAGSVTLATLNKGKYKIKVVSPYHIDYEDTIDAY